MFYRPVMWKLLTRGTGEITISHVTVACLLPEFNCYAAPSSTCEIGSCQVTLALLLQFFTGKLKDFLSGLLILGCWHQRHNLGPGWRGIKTVKWWNEDQLDSHEMSDFIYQIWAGQAVLKPFLAGSHVRWKPWCPAKRRGARRLRLTHSQRFWRGSERGPERWPWLLFGTERLQVCMWLSLLTRSRCWGLSFFLGLTKPPNNPGLDKPINT